MSIAQRLTQLRAGATGCFPRLLGECNQRALCAWRFLSAHMLAHPRGDHISGRERISDAVHIKRLDDRVINRHEWMLIRGNKCAMRNERNHPGDAFDIRTLLASTLAAQMVEACAVLSLIHIVECAS